MHTILKAIFSKGRHRQNTGRYSGSFGDRQAQEWGNLLEFERMFAEYIGTKNAVAFDSDGDALETALRYYGAEDKEVVVCTNSFISIPNSVVYAGGRVVFADIRAETLSMDPDSFKKCITQKTAGVVVTHIAGFPNPDLKEIMEICEDNSLFMIEDATHAVGALFEGKRRARSEGLQFSRLLRPKF